MSDMKSILSKIEQLPDSVFLFLTSDPERMTAIREQIYSPLRGMNIRTSTGKMTKKEIESLFNVSLFPDPNGKYKYEVTDHNSDRQAVNVTLAYYKSRWDITPERNRGELKEALYCFGQGEVTTDENGRKKYDDGNADWMNRICESAGVTPSPSPDTAQRKAEGINPKSIENRERNSKTYKEMGLAPKIEAASPQTQGAPVADRADLTASSASGNDGLSDIHVFNPLGLDDILNTPPLDFLTDNLIVRHSHNVFFAPAKTGKTYLCLHYAVCLVLGIPFVGMENHLLRNVGYINLDMDRRGFIDRLKQVIKGIKPNSTHDDITYVLSRLRIIDRETIRSSHGHTPNFFKAEYLDDLRLFIVTNDIEFCFIDTFSHIRSGSAENSNDDMAITLQNIESFFSPLECGSLSVHHTGKDGLDARGATALKDNTDLVFGLRKVQNSNTHLQLYTKDPRYISPFELDVYVDIAQITNEETGASKADSYLLTTTDPNLDKSVIIDYLKSIGNVPTSRRNIALGATGRYEDNCKAVDTLHLQGILDRIPSGNGRGYRYWIKNIH